MVSGFRRRSITWIAALSCLVVLLAVAHTPAAAQVAGRPDLPSRADLEKEPLYVIDGVPLDPKTKLIDAVANKNVIGVIALIGSDAVGRYGERARYGAVLIVTGVRGSTSTEGRLGDRWSGGWTGYAPGTEPLIMVDGVKVSAEAANWIESSGIQSVEVIKGKAALDGFGEFGKNGAIIINTKNKPVKK